VWSFIAGAGENISDFRKYCPCAFEQWGYNLPAFIGSDYFCETGNREGYDDTSVFLDDPLWNGEGCVKGKECCGFNNPPWFYKELPQPTNDTLNVILFINGLRSEENLYITEMELYVSP